MDRHILVFLTKLDMKGNGLNMKPLSVSSKDAILQKRPLPVPPPGSSTEYVLSDDDDDESGGVYTEIEDEPGAQPTWFPARKYTRSTSLKRHIESVQDNIATSALLKREAISNGPGSPPPVTRKPLPPPKLPKPGQQQPPYKSKSEPNVSLTMETIDFSELKQKLNKRLSKSPETDDDSEEQTEYEEVQFSTNVSPSLLRINIPYFISSYPGCCWNSSSTKAYHFSSKCKLLLFHSSTILYIV